MKVVFLMAWALAASAGAQKCDSAANACDLGSASFDVSLGPADGVRCYFWTIRPQDEKTVVAVETSVPTGSLKGGAEAVQLWASRPTRSRAWTLPELIDDTLFYSRRISLCPSAALPVAAAVWTDSNGTSPTGFPTNNLLVVALTSTVAQQNVTLKLGARVFGWGTFLVKTGERLQSIKASAQEPQMFEVVFLAGQQLLAIRLNSSGSDAHLCALVAIQNYSCPFLDSWLDASQALVHLTYTSRADVLLERAVVGSRVFLLLFTLPDDTRCGGAGPPRPADRQPRRPATGERRRRRSEQKLTSFVVVEGPRADDYTAPVVAVAVVMALFFACSYLLVGQWPSALALSSACKLLWPCRVDAADDARPPLNDRVLEEEEDELGSASPPPAGELLVQLGQLADTQLVVHIDAPSLLGSYRRSNDGFTNAGTDDAVDLLQIHVDQPPTQTRVDKFDMKVALDALLQAERARRLQGARMSDLVATAEATKHYGAFEALASLFFLLPLYSVVSTLLTWRRDSADGDLCFHNFACARPLWHVRSFNHVFSNVAYVCLGLHFVVVVRFKRQRDGRVREGVRGEAVTRATKGTPRHYGLLTAMGLALAAEGVVSAFYHLCPNSTFFQFDTSFMFVLVTLCSLKLYATRHGAFLPHVAYSMVFGVVAFSFASSVSRRASMERRTARLLQALHSVWLVFGVLNVALLPLLSMHVFYAGHLEALARPTTLSGHVSTALRGALQAVRGERWTDVSAPSACAKLSRVFRKRLILLAASNAISLCLSVGLVAELTSEPTSYMITVMTLNLFFYFLYYLSNKVLCGERVGVAAWLFGALATVCWIVAFLCFLRPATDWTVTAAESRALNRDCALLGFFDLHDLWHLSSAAALWATLMLLLTIDDELNERDRGQIHIF